MHSFKAKPHRRPPCEANHSPLAWRTESALDAPTYWGVASAGRPAALAIGGWTGRGSWQHWGWVPPSRGGADGGRGRRMLVRDACVRGEWGWGEEEGSSSDGWGSEEEAGEEAGEEVEYTEVEGVVIREGGVVILEGREVPSVPTASDPSVPSLPVVQLDSSLSGKEAALQAVRSQSAHIKLMSAEQCLATAAARGLTLLTSADKPSHGAQKLTDTGYLRVHYKRLNGAYFAKTPSDKGKGGQSIGYYPLPEQAALSLALFLSLSSA